MSMDKLTALARQAYGHGWALTEGPMTTRVHAGCLATIRLVRETGMCPGVLEAAMDAGQREGVVAAVMNRRERLYDQHVTAVTKAYRQLVSSVDVVAAVTAFRRELGLTEAADTDAERKRQIATAAAVAALRIVHQISLNPASDDYQTVLVAIDDALADADAEGDAGAIALVADRAGHPRIDFAAAFTDARSGAQVAGYAAQAGGLLGRIVTAQATQIGRALADTADAGHDEAVTATREALAGDSIPAVTAALDTAMQQAFARSASAVYARNGVSEVDFLTTGVRTCVTCLDIEARNPWSAADVPSPPRHPNCACLTAPAASAILPMSDDVARYAEM